MKKFCFLFVCLLLSCRAELPQEIGKNTGNGHRGESGVFRPDYLPDLDTDKSGEHSRHLYLCGVRYPDDYDWVKDEQKGQVQAYVFLLKDGELVYETPAGQEYGVTTDSDMHRILDGHLYLDYSTQTETILRCEDEQLYRVQGREYIKGILKHKNSILTLCQPRERNGEWVLRNDGALWMGGEGNVVGGLYYNSETLSGSSYPPRSDAPVVFSVQKGNGVQWYSNFELCSEQYFYNPVKIYGAGLVKDFRWALYEESDVFRFHEFSLGKYFVFRPPETWVDMDGHPEYMCMLIRSEMGTSTVRRIIWRTDSSSHRMYVESEPYALAVKEDSWYILARNLEGGYYEIVTEKGVEPLPEGARPYSKNCFLFCDGKLYISLILDGKAALYVDGKIQRFSFNGYIDGIVLGE